MQRWIVMTCLSLSSLLAANAWGAPKSPFDGTWLIQASSFKTTAKPDADVLKDGVYWCKTCDPGYHIVADGKFHEVLHHADFDAESVHVINDHTVSFMDTLHGKKVHGMTLKVLPDGQQMVVHEQRFHAGQARGVTYSMKRVAPRPPGSHAISGAWQMNAMLNLPKNMLIRTFKVAGGYVVISKPGRPSLRLKIGAPGHASKGGPDVTASMPSPGRLRLVFRHGGKLVRMQTYTITDQGKAMRLTSHDVRHDVTSQVLAYRQ